MPDNLHTFVILSAKIFKALLDNKTNIMNWVLGCTQYVQISSLDRSITDTTNEVFGQDNSMIGDLMVTTADVGQK